MGDVWGFVTRSFPILPEREAHALMGCSMGGAAAFTLAIKHRDRVRTAIAFMPPLNLRYVDCRGGYHTAFDPECFALRERIGPFDSLGRRRLFALRFNGLFAPMFGRGTQAIAGISDVNPLEVMERCDLRPGELDLYVAYGGKDEFNIAAQVDSFLYFARRRGVEVEVDFDPSGKHDLASGRKQQLRALQWAAQRVPPAR
jgi:S-formylglutathione hydrolase FrmB